MLHKSTWQLPEVFHHWNFLLDSKYLSAVFAEDEAADSTVVTSKAWNFTLLVLRQPVRQHNVVVLCVMKLEAGVLYSNSCQVCLFSRQLEPDASETFLFVLSDAGKKSLLEIFRCSCCCDALLIDYNASVSVSGAAEDASFHTIINLRLTVL